MNLISLLLGYLLIGAVLGLLQEELNYRRMPQRSRALVDYVCSGSIWAILKRQPFTLNLATNRYL